MSSSKLDYWPFERSFARTSYTFRLEQQPWNWDILRKMLPWGHCP